MFVSKSLSVLLLRVANVVAVALIIGLCIHISRHEQQGARGPVAVERNRKPAGAPSAEGRYLNRLAFLYGLTNQTEWLAWRVQAVMRHEDRSSVTDVGLDFASQPRDVVDVQALDAAALRTPSKMTLPARGGAAAAKTDASDFLFGISSSYERIADKNWALLRAWERWLTTAKGQGNGAGLVLMLNEATDRQLQELDDELDARGLDVHLLSTDEPLSMARRYHELVRIFKTYGATLAASGQRKKWFALVDDSVFFPDLPGLGRRLAEHDADDELYISLPRPDQEQNLDGAAKRYRAGAAVLTRRAVERIPGLPCLDVVTELVTPARPKKWDVLLAECAKEQGGLDMRVIPADDSPADDDDHDSDDLPQVDEAGPRPLVLHDYQARLGLDVGMAHLVTDVCGEACFMQRYLFLDDYLVVNGVSISQRLDRRQPGFLKGRLRRHLVRPSDLDRDEAEKRLGPAPSRTNVWRLLDSESMSDGSVWQAYLKRASQASSASEAGDDMDSLIVLIWEQNTRRRLQ